MTDSVSSIIAAQLGDDCSAWTYTLRSLEPFVTAPFEQFTEARSGEGVFTFLTGEGGFLQEFLYGYTGLRWREDRLRLDPMLPPQLSAGLRISGLRWQGRRARPRAQPARHDGDAALRRARNDRFARWSPHRSARALRSCCPRAPSARHRQISPARPATASSADASAPADAALDGSLATAWTSARIPRRRARSR